MKFRISRTSSLLFVCFAMLPLAGHAQTTGTWNTTGTTGLSWNTTTSWTGLSDGLVPNAVGATPNFTFNLTASKAITVDGDKTMGTLTIGDPTSTYYAYTLNAGTPSTSRLIFDQTDVADATITVQPTASTASNVINAGILLNDNLVINTLPTTTTAAVLTLGGVIDDGAGSFSVTKQGPSIATLSGANTYDGGTVIDDGRITATNSLSFGTGPVTVHEVGQAYLSLTGPVANAFTLSGIGYSETAGNLGAIRLGGATVSGPITLKGDARITAHGSTGTLSGNIGESGGEYGLELSNYSTTGDSTITVSGDNSYGYGTTVKGAVVIANSNTAFGTGTVTIQSNGTALRTTRVQLGTNIELPADNDFVLDSDAGTGVSAITSYAGDNTTVSTAIVNGPVEILKKVGGGGHFASTKGSASVLRVMGAVTSPNGVAVVIRQGTVELGGGGTYAAIEITDGKLKLANSNGLCTTSTLTVGTSGTVGDTGTFDLNGFDQTLTGLLAGARPAYVTNTGASAGALTLDIAGSATYAGTFTDGTAALNLVKNGAGTLTLPGTSSGFTGGLSVTDGGLNLTGTLGAAGATATMGTGTTLSGEGIFGGSLTLSGATLNVDGSTSLSVLAAGNLNATGGVTVNLQSLPATPGVIEVIGFGTSLTGNAGNFTLANASGYRTPVFSVAANAVNLTLGAPVDLTWTGTGGSDWDIATTSNWNNPTLTPSPFYYADNVSFGNTGGGTVGVPASVNAANLIINSNDNWLFQGAGTVTAASVTKDGTGSATFETPVNFSGSVALTAGVLKLSPPTGVTSVIPGAITGAGTFVKGGDGIISLPSANAGFTGSTVISKGELVVGNSTAIGTGTLTFGDGTTLPTDISTLTLNSGVVLASPQIVVSATALDARISGIGGSMSNATITKRGTGKLTIGHPSDYTQSSTYLSGSSSIVIEKGTVGFSSRTPLATTTTITLGNSSSATDDTILDIPTASANDQLVLTAAITLGSGATNSQAVVTYTGKGPNGGAPAIEGTVNLNGRDLYIENSSHIDGTTARIYNFKPAISGTGNVRIRGGANPDGTYNAGARPRLMAMTPGTSTSTPNTWVGDIYIETGMVQIGNGSIGTAFNAIPDNAVVYMSAGTCMGFGSSGDTFRGLSGGDAVGALPAALVCDNTSGSGTITVTLTSTAGTENYVYGGTFTGGTRNMKLNKAGPGTQTFNGACSHTGITAITGGKLIVNNTFTSPITVATGATLGGNMTSTSSISASSATLASAKIAPGNSTGTMTAASATMNTGALLDLEIDDSSAPKNDKLVITGTLTLGSAALNLTVAGTAAEPAYVIASYGTLSGTFGTITGKPSNYDLVYNYNDGVSSNNIALVKQTDAYLGWLATYPTLTGANRAPGVDFDNDGLDNGIEFVIGSDPTQTTGSATSGYPAATVTGGNLVFTFKRSTASKAYPVTVETSTDLATWPPANAYLVPTADTAGPPVAVSGETVTVTIPMAPDASKFARIKADIPFTP